MEVLVSVFFIYLCGTVVQSTGRLENITTSTEADWYTVEDVFEEQCIYSNDVVPGYRRSLYKFTTKVFKSLARASGNHFVFSPLSLWVSLAAIAEGTEGVARQELFNMLSLPEDLCIRQQYYMIATSRENPGKDVELSRSRVFIVDESLILNETWHDFVSDNRLTGVINAPLKSDPLTSLNLMRKLFSVHISDLDVSGNSVLLDTLNYRGIWTSAFSGRIIERVPFHNDLGEVIGSVNMMKMKNRVKMAYMPKLKVKFLELPVGFNSRYRLFFCVAVGNNSIERAIKMFKSELVFKIIKNLRVSQIPLEVSIPQYTAKSEIDMRRILEQLGVKSVWTDPYATRNISTPPALPSGFVQRNTVTLGRPSLTPYIEDPEMKFSELTSGDTGLDAEIGRDFIADRPFVLTLADTATYSFLFTSIFSKPLA